MPVWLDALLPEHAVALRGFVARAAAPRERSAGNDATRAPSAAELLQANRDAEYTGAVSFEATPEHATPRDRYVTLEERDIGERLRRASKATSAHGKDSAMRDPLGCGYEQRAQHLD